MIDRRASYENEEINLALQATSAIGIAVTGVALLLIGSELRLLRRQVQRRGLRVQLDCETDDSCCHGPSMKDLTTGSAIYVWRQGQWELEADMSEPGYETTPPRSPGAYELQAIRKPSVPIMSR